MKIDSALREFSEKYDRNAIKSIEEISKDSVLSYNKKNHINGVKGFHIQESFSAFEEFLNGYSEYKIENMNNAKASSHESIIEHTKTYIDEKLFEECNLLYPQLPMFVGGYINGINSLTETVDTVKEKMMEAGVDPESIASVNDFIDTFMDKLYESFDPTMDRILWASGYNSKSKLAKSTEPKILKPVFL